MKIKDFQTFLNEKTGGLHKVIMCVSKTISDFDYVTNDGMQTRNYMTLFSKGDEPFKADMPVLNFCNIHTQRLLDAFRLYYTYEKNNFFTSVYYVLRLSYYAFIKKLNIYKTHG